MIYLYVYISMIIGAFCTLIALTAMRRREKHNVGKFGWLLLLIATPPIGLVLFALLGGKKISAEHDSREIVELPQPVDAENDTESYLAKIAETRGLARPSNDNRMELLVTPESIHEALFDLIDSARERLFVHTFMLIDDKVGNRIVDCLCEKAKSGVEVRLMVDGFGSFRFPNGLLDKVQQAGGHITRFKPFSHFSRFAYLNFRNHRKVAVADGNRTLLGGANFVEYEITTDPDDETWIDYAMQIEGIAARQIEAVFLSDWNFATADDVQPTAGEIPSVGDPSSSRTTLQVIPVGPDGPTEILDDLWLTAINRAKDRVWILTPYLVPPPLAMRSLAIAVRRGVDVQIVYPDNSDMPPADFARHDYVTDLHRLGATILRMPDRMLHAKMLIADQEVAYGGSANFDMRSFFLNYELVVGVFDSQKIDELARWFEELAERCIEGPKEATTKRKLLGVLTRIFGEEL